MPVLVYQSLTSLSSASSGVGSLYSIHLTIYLNNSIQQVSSLVILVYHYLELDIEKLKYKKPS